MLGVPDNEKLDLGVKDGPTTNSMVIKGKFQKWKELKAGISDLPNVKVYLPDGFTLVTGTKNISSISHSHVNDSATIDAASNYLQRLNRLNKIYVPKRDEKIDTMKLVAAHKPYYVDIENKTTTSILCLIISNSNKTDHFLSKFLAISYMTT